MSSMVLDAARFNSLVLPNLEQAKKKLAETAKYGTQIASNIPVSTTYGTRTAGAREAMLREKAKNLAQRLGAISSNVNTITVKLDAKVEKAKLIEKKNKARTTGLAAAAGAVAGAAIGAATGGIARGAIKGAVVGGAVAAAGAVVAKKTNVISSIGKALKNTGAKIAKNVGNFFKSIGNGLKKIGKSIANACKKIANKVVSFVKEKIGPVVKAICKGVVAVGKFLWRTAATVVNLAISLVEGICSLVEAIGDVVLIVVGGVCSVFTAFADVVRGICTGEWDWKCTSAVWKKWVLPWVGYDWTSKFAFKWASNSVFDQYAFSWAKRDGGLGYKIGKGVGYVVGIIALTAVTAGGGTAAVSAASAASAAGASTIGAAGAGAAAFVSTATAAVGTSTIIAGTAKFGAEMQKGYNSLGLEPGQEISTKDAWKLVGSSAVKAGVEAATWYVTYGGGAGNLAKSSNKALAGVGKALTGSSKMWWKAGMQAGKEFANEGANSILTGKYDLESAITGAVVSAGTSILYDVSIGKWLGNADKKAMESYAQKSTADQSRIAMLDDLDDEAVKAQQEALKSQQKEIVKHLKEEFDLDYYMTHGAKDNWIHISQAAGGKKAFGKVIKDNYKQVIKIPVEGIAEAITGAQ